MDATPAPRTDTWTGASRGEVVVPSPTSPWTFAPQHHTLPSGLRAHTWSRPPDTAVTPGPSAVIWTGMVRGVTIVPSPTWPASLRPQHHRVPSCFFAQVV